MLGSLLILDRRKIHLILATVVKSCERSAGDQGVGGCHRDGFQSRAVAEQVLILDLEHS